MMPQAQLQTVGASAPAVPEQPCAGGEACELRVDGLRKSFGKNRAVLQGVSFAVHRREAVALIGSNGAGKSTALRCALRLVEPDAGSLTLFDEDITSAKARRLRHIRAEVGFVFQKHNLVPRVSALTNVIHGNLGRAGGIRGWSQAFAPSHLRERAMACLERVGLADQARKRADQLSGGQSQRVAIARALMQDPKMIVADEPVASLDPVAGQEVMDLFHQLTREEGITLLFTSHNVQQALDYSDRVLALKQGAIVLDQRSANLSAADLGKHYG
ncbi:phosphonate ABC transporter ATP-binding protein [Roseibium sediminicola]|uniref:Phosphonate ABC transporter ATP-binding protein n=1 Tax=Roseibium sediminicola TaxID=2933272 RepID=A0ABT0GYT1_9HYPH|nr:phosphonate ABC transporter ATP-binding protein [Roseibium sp. CAU 1639]MCK7614583.1 phosphonate ABC transporter ATP-binding protein [Roseibium sp. CAU 1639]